MIVEKNKKQLNQCLYQCIDTYIVIFKQLMEVQTSCVLGCAVKIVSLEIK